MLRAGTEREAGFRPGTMARLSAICDAWSEDSGEPFVTLVARHGIVVFHEARGSDPDRLVGLDTPMPMASITKAFAGVLFGMFADQGLIGIDDPVGRWLPVLPAEGPSAITMRHCFTHTTGLTGHAAWNGSHNPWLESVIAAGVGDLPVGRTHDYNGMGYALAGKAMEMAAGESIFRLFRTHLFGPLGCDRTHLEEDLAFGADATAHDLATIGQLLLNGGSYGMRRWFGPETAAAMLPVDLGGMYPGVRREWGIGLTWMRDRHPDAGRGGVAWDTFILSDRTFGHGSATAAVLRVDPENGLVIAQARRRAGERHREHLASFLLAVREGLTPPE